MKEISRKDVQIALKAMGCVDIDEIYEKSGYVMNVLRMIWPVYVEEPKPAGRFKKLERMLESAIEEIDNLYR